ncbi:ATP-binding protein [Amycolatopsis sp. NPDC049868]|uniref:ATP-binding protein n=1 Tax=Amycolatopsis sp. NPDC049868 TaxID=3363934 RepID=UPI00378A9DDC
MVSRVELFALIRRDARVEDLSVRALADRHGVHRRTVRQALGWAVPPPRKTPARSSPVTGPLHAAMDEMVRADLDAPRKKRHTAHRIWERLVDEHNATIAYGTAEAGFKVRYVTAAALVNELVEAADDKHLSKTIARYGRVDLLCLDELGYLELDWRGAELLFQVFIEREERSSIAIASNSAFSEWARTFTDPRLCAAIVDRLTFDASIIETGTESFRLRTTKRRPTNRAS